jgi:hypothetical protein
MIKEGDFVMGNTSEGMVHGMVEHVMNEGGIYGVPGTEYAIISMPPENPAMAVRVYKEEDGKWEPTAYSIGMMAKDATIIDMNNHSMENEETDSEVSMAMYDSQIGKAETDGSMMPTDTYQGSESEVGIKTPSSTYDGCGCQMCMDINVDCKDCPTCSDDINPDSIESMYNSEMGKAKKPDYAGVISNRKGSPSDKELYARVIAAAKDKFNVYPSAYANAWVVAEYKRRGGKYGSSEKSDCCSDIIKQAPCWDGYVQRGMKPGEGGKPVPNCVPAAKVDDLYEDDDTVVYDSAEVSKADGYSPPEGARSAARRAIKYKEDGKANGAGTPVGWTRAGQLARGESISLSTVKRMYSFFSRHEVDKKGKDFDNASNPSNGKIMWLAWGGDAGYSWSRGIANKERDKALFSGFGKDYSKAIQMTDIFKGLGTGSMVSWNSSGGRAEGKITRVITDGTYKVPGTSVTVSGTKEDPAAVIRLYRDGKPTDTIVAHKIKTLRAK